MESILKGAHLLEIDQKIIHEMEKDALTVWQDFRVTFKVLKVTRKDVTIGATQMKTKDDQYLDQKRLIYLTHNGFDKYFPGIRILVHASTYEESPAQKIDAAWIKKKMEDHSIKLKDIVEESGLGYSQLSHLINGSKPLSDAMKAMFYFYFKSKE